jgi:hypothetical protein
MSLKMKSLSIAVLAVLFASGFAYAESGADALLQSVGAPTAPAAVPAGNKAAAVNPMLALIQDVKSLKLDDPFILQMYSDFMMSPETSFEVKLWIQKVGKQDYEGAAHLWSALRGKFPAKLENQATAVQAYLLYKLNLAQTFTGFWIANLERESYRNSPVSTQLENVLASFGFDKWFFENKVQLDAAQVATVDKLDATRSAPVLTLKAFAAQRDGAKAKQMLAVLPKGHELIVPLAKTAALAAAKAGNLAEAGRDLKTYVEPALAAKKDAKLWSQYDLQIARLLYQAGSMDGAAQYYQKIPRGSPDYLIAQEELAWVWLRTGTTDRLRGSLATLGSEVFANRFQPEVYLVRAIANLKFCYYPDVEKDFVTFRTRDEAFAKKIDAALAANEPPVPYRLSTYAVWAKEALAARKREAARIADLSERSISAVLPAVGVQSHWKDAAMALQHATETAKKRLDSEYRMAWNADRIALRGAIRKMQFVRVELLSELAMAASGDQVLTGQSSAKRAAPTVVADAKDQVYPFDGVVWSDELFKLRSVARGKCLGQ